jgi:GNAT superfamily N-acetyltransferase
MRFRPALPADEPRLDAIMHASSGYASPEMRKLILSVHADVRPREGHAGYVLEDDCGIAGFHTLVRVDEEVWELDLFFVDNTRQGEGLGRTLFAHAADTARQLGARRMLIVSNPAAEAFYLRMGAVRTGTKPAGGRFGWDRPVMEFTLQRRDC